MTPREFWTTSQFQAVTGGRWQCGDGSPCLSPLAGVCIDSRTIRSGQVFIAIKGDRFDGHDFLIEAVSNGAGLLVVERCSARTIEAVEREATSRMGSAPVSVLQVENTIAALAQLAAAYRRCLAPETTVIGITGTNGKTTTRRIVQTVLSQTMQGSASVRSFNNHIGVPLTVLGAQAGDRYLVAEVGTSAPGEIESLAEILRPDVAVITSIGPGHLDGLGTVPEVAREKTALLRLMQPGDAGLAVVNADADIDPPLLNIPQPLTTFGWSPQADLCMMACQESMTGTDFQLSDQTGWHVPLLGRHSAGNATVAIAIARHLGLSDQTIQAGLSAVTPEPMRLALCALPDETRVINDAYNANPDSMLAALACLVQVSSGRPAVAVLGDMLELGPDCLQYHREVVRQAVQDLESGRLSRLVLIGPTMQQAADAEQVAGHEHVIVSADHQADTLAEVAAQAVSPGDLVLVKASRGMALERFVDAVRSQCADRNKKGCLDP
ncbi:MAG: UDP-N-acetylmuramoyl-tripeptide--D-alanyl-D-alanine ligase [Planctomycetes bacterium]|nr:UDP-N-acetylmuramoyl-tripeptide--D-alanyl-D-alanine ligase [Planctomycetota bacterium]NOG55104.1 UDP-N-acetylmuramoyl-tripeptide--D-alanyl-D-alanine ligase [Planctomycetota bacterium]